MALHSPHVVRPASQGEPSLAASTPVCADHLSFRPPARPIVRPRPPAPIRPPSTPGTLVSVARRNRRPQVSVSKSKCALIDRWSSSASVINQKSLSDLASVFGRRFRQAGRFRRHRRVTLRRLRPWPPPPPTIYTLISLPTLARPFALLFCASGIGMPRSENSSASSCARGRSV